MRISARVPFLLRAITSVVLSFIAISLAATTSYAQTTTSFTQFQTPQVDSSVPQNHHSYTQIKMFDILSSVTCLLAGVDATQPNTPCLVVNPATGIVMAPDKELAFGEDSRMVGGAAGFLAQQVGVLYTPAITSGQYFNYLANNFGIVKSANAQTTRSEDCTTLAGAAFGYGFCGFQSIFELWLLMRDMAYAILTLAFIFLGLGVMLRFKVDPRTVMTLQNRIPKVIIVIIMITFTYPIVGFMGDLMWVTTYTGVNMITARSEGDVCVEIAVGGTSVEEVRKIAEGIPQQLVNQPVSFADTLFSTDCGGFLDNSSGLLGMSNRTSDAFGGLIMNIVSNLFGVRDEDLDCGIIFGSAKDCLYGFFLWLISIVVKIVIVVALITALFRLWFQLIKAFVRILINTIISPIIVVLGVIPGNKFGVERFFRTVGADYIIFPLSAWVLILGRVFVDAVPETPSPESVFVPPLVGNTNIASFSTLLGFGAVMIAPTIGPQIKEKLGVPEGKTGAAFTAGVSGAIAATTSPATKAIKHLNRKNPTTGVAEGALAVAKSRAWQKTPFGKRSIAKRSAREAVYKGGDYKKAFYDNLSGQYSDIKGKESVATRYQKKATAREKKTGRGQNQANAGGPANKPKTGGP